MFTPTTPQSAIADSSPARGAFTQLADRTHAFTRTRGTEGYARKMTTTGYVRTPVDVCFFELTFVDHDFLNHQSGIAADGEVNGPIAGKYQKIVAAVVLQKLRIGA